MKAAVLTENKKILIKKIPKPTFNHDECLVKITNVCICSSDVQRAYSHGAYNYPLIMGHEMSGKIVKIGSNVTHLKTGDKVAIYPLMPCFKCEPCNQKKYMSCKNYNYYGSRTNGGYAEYLNIKSWNLIKVDKKINLKDVACLEPMSVSLHCLNKMELNLYKKNKILSIAIIGAGFLGLLLAQILRVKYPNHKISIIDRNIRKIEIAKKYLNEAILLDEKKSWNNFLKKNENSYDITVEATGVPYSFLNSIKLVNEGGKSLWIGNIINDLRINKKIVSSILRKEIKIIGVWNSYFDPKNKSDEWRESIKLIQESKIKPSELISHFIEIDEIPEYLKKLYEHKCRKIKFESLKIMINN